MTPDEKAEADRLQAEKVAEARADNERLMQRWPHLRATHYRTFFERIRDNFHLIFQYSPTGTGFRERITSHKELLYLSQVLFVTDL